VPGRGVPGKGVPVKANSPADVACSTLGGGGGGGGGAGQAAAGRQAWGLAVGSDATALRCAAAAAADSSPARHARSGPVRTHPRLPPSSSPSLRPGRSSLRLSSPSRLLLRWPSRSWSLCLCVGARAAHVRWAPAAEGLCRHGSRMKLRAACCPCARERRRAAALHLSRLSLLRELSLPRSLDLLRLSRRERLRRSSSRLRERLRRSLEPDLHRRMGALVSGRASRLRERLDGFGRWAVESRSLAVMAYGSAPAERAAHPQPCCPCGRPATGGAATDAPLHLDPRGRFDSGRTAAQQQPRARSGQHHPSHGAGRVQPQCTVASRDDCALLPTSAWANGPPPRGCPRPSCWWGPLARLALDRPACWCSSRPK
jgi:hypothetical protein